MSFSENNPVLRRTLKLVFAGLLVGMGVVLTRYLSIETPILRIGFSFIAIAMAGVLLGPAYAGVVGALIDVVGYVLKPSGPYFPGFTVSGVLHGLTYGLLLYRRRPAFWRVVLASFISAFLIGGFVTSFWLTILQSNTLVPGVYWSIFATRAVPALAMFPVQLVVIFALWKALQRSHIAIAVPR